MRKLLAIILFTTLVSCELQVEPKGHIMYKHICPESKKEKLSEMVAECGAGKKDYNAIRECQQSLEETYCPIVKCLFYMDGSSTIILPCEEITDPHLKALCK